MFGSGNGGMLADELPEVQTHDIEGASRRDLFQMGALLGVATMPGAAAAGPLRADAVETAARETVY